MLIESWALVMDGVDDRHSLIYGPVAIVVDFDRRDESLDDRECEQMARR